MLDAMDEDTVLTDGNEPAYYYHDKAQCFQIYHYIRQTASWASPQDSGMRAQVQVAQAPTWTTSSAYAAAPTSSYMTPEERAQWFEHNTYWALYLRPLRLALFGEDELVDRTDVPPGLEQAVINSAC